MWKSAPRVAMHNGRHAAWFTRTLPTEFLLHKSTFLLWRRQPSGAWSDHGTGIHFFLAITSLHSFFKTKCHSRAPRVIFRDIVIYVEFSPFKVREKAVRWLVHGARNFNTFVYCYYFNILFNIAVYKINSNYSFMQFLFNYCSVFLAVLISRHFAEHVWQAISGKLNT